MPISVVCQCGKKFLAKDEHAGARTKCPVCGQPLTIPKPGDSKPATATAAPSKPNPAAAANVPPTATPATQPAAPAKPPAAAPKVAVAAPPAARPSYEGKHVADWLDLLEIADPASRKHAAAVLATIGPEAGTELPVFIKKLEAEHVLIRHWAVSCLEKIGPQARGAVDALVKRLDDEEPLIRDKAALALEKVEPACAAFVSRLRQGLKDKGAEIRASAVVAFRRDMKTLGVSRCRFWTCPCGSVFEKQDLEDRLTRLADGIEIKWEGTSSCKKCGKSYALREVYAGKYDVPQKFWPQLIKRFGDRVRVPDDFLTDPAQPTHGYRLSESQIFEGFSAGVPGGSSSMPVIPAPSAEMGEGYAMAEAPQVHHAVLSNDEPEDDKELVPGAKVPKSGKYKCTACHKVRITSGKSAVKTAAPVQVKTVIKYFKAGKTFAECPHCGDITEWQFVE
jgi:hypothetical protein